MTSDGQKYLNKNIMNLGQFLYKCDLDMQQLIRNLKKYLKKKGLPTT